ncbi:MAG: ABC transporter permease [Anaerolineaceae bacterium]|nr:ABC transporter permease [Anaerolineaceae bacterium]
MNNKSTSNFILKNGFYFVILVVIIYFSAAAPHFLSFSNFNGLFHAAAPLLVIATAMSLVVFIGKLDISLGSIAYLSCSVGVTLVKYFHINPLLALATILITGALCGALNGFIVTILKVNPLVATLGTMTALRGLGLVITQSYEYRIPADVRSIGNATILGIYTDVWLALLIIAIMAFVQMKTVFGRQLMAIGNGEQLAERLGVEVKKLTFISFILAGTIASIGGIISMLQIGSHTFFLGLGYEFSAVAAVVLGGISLFGGEGYIFPGVLVGAFTLQLIQNGLNQVGANPYLYSFINGGIIFLAMAMDALKTTVRTQVKLVKLPSNQPGSRKTQTGE